MSNWAQAWSTGVPVQDFDDILSSKEINRGENMLYFNTFITISTKGKHPSLLLDTTVF
jgi:hypothetical protein